MELMDTVLWYCDDLKSPWQKQPVVFDDLAMARMIAFAIVWKANDWLYYGDIDFWAIIQPQVDLMIAGLKPVRLGDVDGYLASALICSDGFNKLKPSVTKYLHKISK